MGFFFIYLISSQLFAAASNVSLICVLKDGDSKEISFSLSLSSGESSETIAIPKERPRLSYRMKAKLQEVIVREQSKMVVDYEIEKTEAGRKLMFWKFPREIFGQNEGFQIQMKGKTPQSSLRINCKENGAGN